VAGFNLDKVRQAGSVSGSQLTHYFVDRSALIQAVVERQIELVLAFHRQPRMAGLDTFGAWERWADLNVEHLRRTGYNDSHSFCMLAGQLAKSDEATRHSLAMGYQRWVNLLEESFSRMQDAGALVDSMSPRDLAVVVVAGHEGAGVLALAHRRHWPMSDGCRFLVNHVRAFAVEPAEREAGRQRHLRRAPSVAVSAGRGGGDVPLNFTGKGLATRARITRGAADLFFARGLHRTSLDEVRTSVGVSGSQLSHYFGGKRDLTRAVVALRARDVRDFDTRAWAGHDDGRGALRTWAQAYFAEIDVQYLRGGCIYGSLAGELLEADDRHRDDVSGGYDHWLKNLHEGLTTVQRRGDLMDEADTGHLAAALLVAHQGGALLTYVTGTADPFRLAITAAVDYVGSFALRLRESSMRNPDVQGRGDSA
jgi:AcrR family transcriptional regulator